MNIDSLFSKDLAPEYSSAYYESKFSILPVYKVVTIVMAISFFSMVYTYAASYYPNVADLRKRESFVSLAHSTVASGLASYVLLYRHSLWQTPASYSEPIEFCDVIFSISYGYFIWDVYISFAVDHPIDFKIHAVFCFVVYSLATFTPYMHRPSLIVLLFEVSTIFLHCSRIATDQNKKQCALVLQMAFAVTFFIFRIVVGFYVSYELVAIFVLGSVDVDYSELPRWIYCIALTLNFLFTILNVYWFGVIVKMGMDTIGSKRKLESN